MAGVRVFHVKVQKEITFAVTAASEEMAKAIAIKAANGDARAQQSTQFLSRETVAATCTEMAPVDPARRE